MSSSYIGQITMFSGNFPPKNWAFCNGQILAISQNTALFSILGTTYGGNGTTNFALPDLRGRVPLHSGQGPGLTNYTLGEAIGTENVTLLASQIPSHTHAVSVNVSSGAPNTVSPAGAVLAASAQGNAYTSGSPTTAMAANAVTVGAAGGSNVPLPNMQPILTVNFIICLFGIFPSRN
jgi:microcystin-dependent protein